MRTDMSLPLISLIETCTPPGMVIRTPFSISDDDAHNGITDFDRDDIIVTGAIEGNDNLSSR